MEEYDESSAAFYDYYATGLEGESTDTGAVIGNIITQHFQTIVEQIPEDWMTGGYEPNIAIWGPLQGEQNTAV